MFDFMFSGFQKKANLDFTRVPYRDTVQAATDLAEGRIQLMLSAIAIVRPHVQAGKLKMLAVTAAGARRWRQTFRRRRRPDSPT